MKNNTIDTITLGIVWDHLISIADEILLTLVRTSFSITVREAWDVGAVIFDRTGRPVAQGSQSTPAFYRYCLLHRRKTSENNSRE